MNVDDAHIHLKKLKSISKSPIIVKRSDQYHRYFWLPAWESPGCLREQVETISKPETDYSESCTQIEKFWRKKRRLARETAPTTPSSICTFDAGSFINSQSTMIILPDRKVESMCKEFSKRDNISQILVDATGSQRDISTYQQSYTNSIHTRDPWYNTRYHLKSNPISKYGEALIIHKSSIR
jgi:hypothetical protein